MILKPIDPSDALPLADGAAKAPKGLPTGDDLKRLLSVEQQRLGELQSAFYADRRHALLVVLQGRDASGKDGTIRSVFDACNPQGCQVASFKAPTDLELSHDFLWRVHQVVPPKGMIGIFNRSHYEDVLVVRVKNFVPKSVWSRRYRQINDFEQMLTENGVVILKFFLHISKEEQREQFLERLTDPTKNWKFRAGDLDDRALWGEYTRALPGCPAEVQHQGGAVVPRAVGQSHGAQLPHHAGDRRDARRAQAGVSAGVEGDPGLEGAARAVAHASLGPLARRVRAKARHGGSRRRHGGFTEDDAARARAVSVNPRDTP
jgi:PPK2 family polyphosphate:nucleotide phosphotransferase